MISGGSEVDQFAYICFILEAKFRGDALYIIKIGNKNSS